MSADENRTAENNTWPFENRAFVWAVTCSGMHVARILAGFSIPAVVFQSESGKTDGSGEEEGGRGVTRVRGKEVLRVEGHFGQFRIRISEQDGGVTECEAGFVLVVEENPEREDRGTKVSLPESNLLTTEGLEALASSEGDKGVPDSLGVWLDPAEGLPDRVPAERALRALLKVKRTGGPDCYVLARHVPLWGLEGQALYDDLREKGVRFLRLGSERPIVKAVEGQVQVEVRDAIVSGETVRLRLDRLLMVGQPSPPPGAGNVAQCVGDPLDAEGFLQKDNPHLYPSRSFRKGIYYLGSCKGEQAEEELEEEILAILPEVLAPAAAGEILAPAGIRIDKGHCVSCLTCYRVCPHHALDIAQGPVPVPIDPACYGCGLCAALCPGNAIELVRRPCRQILEALEPAGAGGIDSSRTVLFCCSRLSSGLAGDGTASFRPAQAGASVIEVPCACSVSEEMLLAAFLKGAAKVGVVGCHSDNCVSQKGTVVGERRAKRVARYLEAGGRDPAECMRFVAAAPNEAHRLAHILQNLEGDPAGPKEGPAAASAEGEV